MFQHRILASVLTLAAVSGLIGLPRAAQASEVLIANADTSASSGSLSVNGISQINVPADQAIVLLTFYPSNYSSDYSTPSSASQMLVQPADIKSMTDALTAAGVPAGDIKAFPDPTSLGAMRVRLSLSQPSQARIQQVIEAANTAAVKTNRFIPSGVSVGYTVRECGSFEDRARQAAMTDAQNRAAALANVSGREVGSIVSLMESVTWGANYSTTCPLSSDPTIYSDYYSLPVYEPSIEPMVRVVYSLSVTYDMQ